MLVSEIQRNEVSTFLQALDGKRYDVCFTKRTTGEIRVMAVRNLTEADVNGKGANYSLAEKQLHPVVDLAVEAEGGRAVKSFGIPEAKLFIVDGVFYLIRN